MNDWSTLLLEHHLTELKPPSLLRGYGKMAAQCAAEGVDHPQYLLRLAKLELMDCHQRMVERRIRAARFPAVKSLDTFAFPAIPSLNKALVMELARCEYIQRRDNVIAAGSRTGCGGQVLPGRQGVEVRRRSPGKRAPARWSPFSAAVHGHPREIGKADTRLCRDVVRRPPGWCYALCTPFFLAGGFP